MDDRIILAHGGGGALTRELIEELIIPALDGAAKCLPDAAALPRHDSLLMTTDAFVVKPPVFPGGDIGSLSVYGTVNDLAVSGAEPLALSMSLIIEEGLETGMLKRVVSSAAKAAAECRVKIITGDTKVVARGEADQIFITTAGIGRRVAAVSPDAIRTGDAIVLNGPIAEHGIAIMSMRDGIEFETPVQSDAATVWPAVKGLFDAGIEVHAMRDLTRGGLAAACVELANDSQVTLCLQGAAIPVRPAVRAACEMLGVDYLSAANESKFIAFVPGHQADAALAAMKSLPGGESAAVIGYAHARQAVPAFLHTRFGGKRVIEMPYGEDLPRIC